MAKKDRTFASKVAKAAQKEALANHCPVCGEVLQMVQLVSSEQAPSGDWKFRDKFVGVCK